MEPRQLQPVRSNLCQLLYFQRKMPSLFEFGEGILRTHFTWEDLQKECFDVFGDSAIFGPNKGATSIGDGRGFMSKMCLIDPDWKEGTDAPKKFVVKICCQLAMTEAQEMMKGKSPDMNSMMESVGEKMQEALSESVRQIHSHEVNVYNLIEKYNITGIPVPKVYKAVKFTEDCKFKGFLIMEYIEGAVNLNIFDNISVEDVKQALKGIAALEAASLNFSDEEKSSLPCSTFKQLFQTMVDPTMMAATMKILKEFSNENLHPKIDKMDKALPDLMDLSVFDMGAELDMTSVLVHGDAWSTNMLWRKTDGDHLKLAAVVDFQTAHFGIPAADVLRLLGATLSGKDRQKNWEKLSEYFYNELLLALNGAPAPYTLQQLKENCRRFYPMSAALLVPMMGPIFQMNQQNPDEETKRKVLEVIHEKMECLIDDMLFYHERNMQLKAKTDQ